jgi:adenylate kinase family enzyme
MATEAQIKANRENAQKSAGPATSAGAARSSRNAVTHGLTGQTLVISPEEAESYAAHVEHYMERFQPVDHYHRQLVQQLADSDWGVHQIFLLQSATISYMQTLSRRLAEADAETTVAIEASDARAVRKLATLNSYENRKRRTSKLLLEQLEQFQQEIKPKAATKPKETEPRRDIGFFRKHFSRSFISNRDRFDPQTSPLTARFSFPGMNAPLMLVSFVPNG